MIIEKWNLEKREYEPWEVPEDWHVSCYETDMGRRVNCAGCGEEVAFGDTYTSRVLHTKVTGFGYGVCEKCHRHEMEAEGLWARA